ncbi:TPA_exp: putative Methyltransferase [Trichophyton benhamiae CBS 112371]|uniref:Methyltransferase, putative n=1 Tax=Arthroderma benhamiae (strain ATCC MYA-4681 / CBS 112371) TaxID=663331 RepID=D4ALM0_ARTBC|nr:methyltransferase, putative [Trichophyton benhamiae CBS 112371]EFE36279.1 methyltransferase, putative [Trichophyton benhamiae CBS 112371]DAA79080.1 TPA_exp: putative Methyltransferase [Trichophyton benhamiae CBS 112371]
MSATATTTTSDPHVVLENDVNHIPRGDVEAPMQFFEYPEDGSEPYNLMEGHLKGGTQPNYPLSTHTISITDIRGKESEYSLAKHGFQGVSNVPSAADPSFCDEENIKSVWYPEVEKFVGELFPEAKRIFIFNHIVRRSQPGAEHSPLISAHIDQTLTSTKEAIGLFFPPEEVAELLKDRYRVLNIWRPINGTVQSYPLAVAMPSSVPDDDLVRIELRYPQHKSETQMLKYSPAHKWYYWSGMTNEDRLAFMIMDSKEDAVARRTAHASFADPRTPAGAKPRESIETRVFVFG